MRAVGFQDYGPVEAIELLHVPAPAPGPGEVAVRVEATTVNPADTQYRRGDHANLVPDAVPPLFGGLEFAGVVEAVGEGAQVEVGTHVVGTSHFIPDGRGSHAERVVVDASWVVPRPDGLSPAQATTIPMNGLTARVVLDSLDLPSGTEVLVTGAAGAVGGMVTELGARQGLHVIAVSAARDEDDLRAMGAAEFVERGDDLVARLRERHPGGIPAVVDAAMLDEQILPITVDGGQFITLRPGHEPGRERNIAPRFVSFRRHQGKPAVLQDLMELAAAGHLTPRVAHELPPEQGQQAHRLVETSGLRGRVVLRFA